jgi:4-hydroxybenzoyl-CoA thioesterase
VTALSHRRSLTIEWGHCDPAGIVGTARLFEFFDWSTTMLFQKALGMTKTQMVAQFQADMPLVDARAKFLKSARFGDVVEIVSSVSEFRRSSFDVRHQLFNAGELSAEAQETRVWVARNASNPFPLTSKPIPPQVMDRFKIP